MTPDTQNAESTDTSSCRSWKQYVNIHSDEGKSSSVQECHHVLRIMIISKVHSVDKVDFSSIQYPYRYTFQSLVNTGTWCFLTCSQLRTACPALLYLAGANNRFCDSRSILLSILFLRLLTRILYFTDYSSTVQGARNATPVKAAGNVTFQVTLLLHANTLYEFQPMKTCPLQFLPSLFLIHRRRLYAFVMKWNCLSGWYILML